jgi:hypothetical protein
MKRLELVSLRASTVDPPTLAEICQRVSIPKCRFTHGVAAKAGVMWKTVAPNGRSVAAQC